MKKKKSTAAKPGAFRLLSGRLAIAVLMMMVVKVKNENLIIPHNTMTHGCMAEYRVQVYAVCAYVQTLSVPHFF